jgi:hypothetical protein
MHWVASALFSLLCGSALALTASIKMHDPEFLATNPWQSSAGPDELDGLRLAFALVSGC